MKICGVQKMDCMMQAESELFATGAADACDCLPHCNTIIYDIAFHQRKQSLPMAFFIDHAIPNIEK